MQNRSDLINVDIVFVFLYKLYCLRSQFEAIGFCKNNTVSQALFTSLASNHLFLKLFKFKSVLNQNLNKDNRGTLFTRTFIKLISVFKIIHRGTNAIELTIASEHVVVCGTL